MQIKYYIELTNLSKSSLNSCDKEAIVVSINLSVFMFFTILTKLGSLLFPVFIKAIFIFSNKVYISMVLFTTVTENKLNNFQEVIVKLITALQ